MPTSLILIDLFGLLLAVIGFHMAFRQHLVRVWWRRLKGLPPAPPPAASSAGEDEDPVHYALIIFGMMMLAFGVLIFAFNTAFHFMT